MSDPLWRINSDTSLVIRTDFAHADEWADIRAAIVEPQTEGEFVAYVQFVDDKTYDGLTAPGLLRIAPTDGSHDFAFLVDTLALTRPDRPILVVNLHGRRHGDTFRVVPSEMWAVQNNLSLSNMDWEDFADNADDDRIFRGFE